jgi:hypothetical protein
MSELVSSVELRKADGKPIKFNFQFENGLPIKPLLQPSYEIWFSEKVNKYGITVIIKDDFKVNDFTLSNISYHNTDVKSKDIWIHLPDCYLVIKEINNSIVEIMKKDGIGIIFINEDGKQL